jgi:shikimate kinase
VNPPAERIALIGLRGAGKTSVGRALAQLLGWSFVDLDELLSSPVAGAGPPLTAGEILKDLGEERFRDLESAALEQALAAPGPLVLATGGGVVLRERNRERLAACRCVWLEVTPEQLLERIEAEPRGLRPPLTKLEPLAELRQQESERRDLYRDLAEFSLDGEKDGVLALAKKIAARTGASSG